MAPDTQAPGFIAKPPDAQPAPPRGRLLGRIGTRAAVILVLMFSVLGFLAANSLILLTRQGAIIEQMGVRDRAAIEAVDDFSNDVSDFAQGFAAVLAGVLPPTVTAPRMLRNALGISESFDLLIGIVGTRVNPIAAGGARDMAARLPDLGERVRDAFARRARDQYAPLQEEWLDMVVAFNTLSSQARAIAKADADANRNRAHVIQDEGRLYTYIAAGMGLLGLALVWFVLVQLTARPLSRLARSMQQLARGDAQVEVTEADRSDQVGEMARAVEVFKTNLANSNRLMEQALEGARRTAVVTNQASQAIGQVSDGSMT